EAVPYPGSLDSPAFHLQVPHLGILGQAEMLAKFGRGCIGIYVARRIDIAVADAIAERDVPDPAGRFRNRFRARLNAAFGKRRRCHDGAVIEKIFAEGAVRFLERALDDRCSKTARVDEEVRFEAAAVVGDKGLYVALLVELDRGDPGID